MPGLPELEPLVVQMVAQLVAEHAQESPEGSDLFENSRGSGATVMVREHGVAAFPHKDTIARAKRAMKMESSWKR